LNVLEIWMMRRDIWGSVWKSYHTDADFRKEAAEAHGTFVGLFAQVFSSSEIAQNLSQLDAAKILTDPDSQRMLRKWKEDLRTSGAFLDAEAKAGVQSLTVDIEAATTLFKANIRDDDRHLDLAPDELSGPPEDFLATHKPDPKTGKIRIASDQADTVPLRVYCLSQETRKKVWYLRQCKGSPQNEAILKRLLRLRHQQAKLLGFSSWAERQLPENMLKTRDAAYAFLQTAFEAVETSSETEKNGIAQLLKSQGYGELHPWNLTFGIELLRKERLQGFDIKSTR
jgi:Zn-dependent oligopeptidase